jgi:VanZ family protein
LKRFAFLLYAWLPPVLLMGLIFYLSSRSGLPHFRSYDFVIKKGAHFSEYGALYLLLFRALYLSGSKPSKPSLSLYVLPGIIAVLFAVSDEIHQSFVPLRHPAARDVLIDAAGIVVMTIVVGKWPALRSGIFLRPIFCKKRTP